MLDRINESDWDHVFHTANEDIRTLVGETCDISPFGREDVAEIIGIDDGEPEWQSWIGVFRLNDGRYAFVEVGCTITGWCCAEGGCATVSTSLHSLIRLGLGDDARDRLRLRA